LSGIDCALWDILGKRLGVPVYQLLGGKARAAVPLYAHASGQSIEQVEERVREWISKGYRHVRVQAATPGYSGYGVRADTAEEVQKMRPAAAAATIGDSTERLCGPESRRRSAQAAS